MSKQKSSTFRLSFIRRRIITLCRSRALRAALLAELHGGPDAALVVEMVERARPPVRPPTQMVAPMPQQNEEEARPVVADPPTQSANPQGQVRPVVADPPTQSANPQGQVRPVVTDPPTHIEAPPQEEATTSDGHSVATAVEIFDSDSEFSD